MNSWLLDDGPFDLLARHIDPTWAWPAATLHMVREVAANSDEDMSGRRQKVLAMRDAAGAPSIQVHDSDALTVTILLEHLRPKFIGAKQDAGEHASIAMCLAQLPEAVFVTMDKGAAFVALAELGPARVATPFDVWSWLHERNLISAEQRRALDEATVKKDQMQRKKGPALRIPYRFANPQR